VKEEEAIAGKEGMVVIVNAHTAQEWGHSRELILA